MCPRLQLLAPLLLAAAGVACGAPAVEEESGPPPAPPAPSADDPLTQSLAELNDPDLQRREPFRVFDNLYYIGIGWVSAWLLDTGEGLVMIDALYGDFVEQAVEGMRQLGFDPQDLEYVLVTHGHFDHVGGARPLQELSGARIGMTAADWELATTPPEQGPSFEPPVRDLVLADGDVVTLGEAEILCYVTPGHTPGVLSLAFTVYDEGKPHLAFTFGGVGLNFSGVERTEMYIRSVRRLQGLDGLEVNVPNHPGMGSVFERAQKLEERQPGDPHPFVDPEGFSDWLAERLADGLEKLEEEKGGVAEPADG